MSTKLLKEIIALAKEEGISELKYETKDTKVELNFNSAPTITPVQMSAPVSMAAPTFAPSAAPANAKGASSDEGLYELTSPFVGTFYTSPAPGKPEFVSVGAKVSKGQTLCILEAMKIMNEIEADVNGEIVEVCVENESLVEFGQVLYKIRVG